MRVQSLVLRVASQNRIRQILLHLRLLLLVGQHVHRAQPVHHVLRLAEVNLVESIADLVLHVLDHPADVGDVRRRLADRTVLLDLKRHREGSASGVAHPPMVTNLPGEAAAQVHRAGRLFVGLQPQHGGGRQLVVRGPSRALLLHLHDVYRVPATFNLFVAIARLLDEDHAGEAMVEVPQVRAGHAALVIHLAVLVEGVIGLDLQLPQSLRRHRAVLQRRVVRVGPRRAVRVTIAVVVAQQVIFARLAVLGDLQRLVDGRQEVLAQGRRQIDEVDQVLLDLLGRQAAHQVERAIHL